MRFGILFSVITMLMISVEANEVFTLEKDAAETTTVSNIEDLRGLLRDSQKSWMAISPPSLETIYWDSRNDDIFVDWFSGGWPKSATKLAVAILDQNLIPRIEIRLWEIPVGIPGAGNIIVENRYGEIMATLKPEQGFSSLGWAVDWLAVSSVDELSDFQKIIYSSSHSALSLILTPVAFAEVCADIREEEALLAEQASSLRYEEEGLAMMSLGSGVELQMEIGRSNGVTEVFVEWVGTLDSATLDLFRAMDLAAANWQLLTNFPTAGATNFWWNEPETTQCFFEAGTDYDEDLDGLTSARERFLYKTREDMADTDLDGLSDFFEIQNGLDPLYGDSNTNGIGDLAEFNLATSVATNGSGGALVVVPEGWYHVTDPSLNLIYLGE